MTKNNEQLFLLKLLWDVMFSIFWCPQIRVTFVNEFGVEEAGIDGGGIFKDFMENITQTAFDVQYGLFKVCNSYAQICENEYLSGVFICKMIHHTCRLVIRRSYIM